MKKQYTMPIKSRYDDPSPDAVLHVTETDYTYWLRDMADRESMPIRPCPKALRRAADKFDAMEKRIKELEAEVKVGNAFHKVCVQQRNAEIEKVNELEAKLKKVAGLPRKWQDISEKQTQEYTGIYGCADELQAILEQS